MAHEQFAAALRAERETVGLSLRGLADAAGLNPGYLSRLEAGQITPQEENLVKLADALAMAVDNRAATRETFRARLSEAAGRLPRRGAATDQVRQEFASRLRMEGLGDLQVQVALENVSVPTMVRVLKGEEPLEILPVNRLHDPDAVLNLDQEVVVIPDSTHDIRAGTRASIHVTGPMSIRQKEQVRLIAKLLASVLDDAGNHGRR